MTIEELKYLEESEDKVEFKEAKRNFPWNGGSHTEQKDRRKCFLGYIVALANEGGGYLVLGMADETPHQVVGSNFSFGKIGDLEDAVYKVLKIRVHIEELFDEKGLRVLLTTIPSRPLGRTLKFEGVTLMRTGDSLRNMSDEEIFAILSEQEPDFSAKPCIDFKLEDIDEEALTILKQKYAIKQKNLGFNTYSKKQVLSDLGLFVNNQLNFAALILIGKKEKIRELLPQSSIYIEYRRSNTAIEFDNRIGIQEPLFIAIEKIWNYINQPASNPTYKLKQGPYIYDIKYFNEDIIREAVLNAIVHRSYNINSEIVIKQFPEKIIITNPGGFPLGVQLSNIITVNSTPRSRLLADILLKTGLVERSGQGIDKLFQYSITESKPAPDYSNSDMLQVEVKLSANVQDPSFFIFIDNEQNKRDDENKLGVFDLITLEKIRTGISENLDTDTLDKLLNQNLIKKSGKTTSEIYTLGNAYFDIAQTEDEIAGYRPIYISMIADSFEKNEYISMKDFTEIFDNKLKRTQVRYMIEKLVNDKILSTIGEGKSTKYELNIDKRDNQNYFDLIKNKLIE